VSQLVKHDRIETSMKKVPNHTIVSSSGCLWWAARICVSRFLSLNSLPLSWFVSGNGDNQNTFPLVLINFHPEVVWYCIVFMNLCKAVGVKQPRNQFVNYAHRLEIIARKGSLSLVFPCFIASLSPVQFNFGDLTSLDLSALLPKLELDNINQ
jgi:hypothetical protein